MQALIGALRVNLGLDSAEFRTGFRNADRTAKRGSEAIARTIRGAAVSIAGALGAISIGSMVRQSLAAVDAQTKLARSLGTTTRSIQVLERAGDLAGVSIGEIEQATLQLTRRLSQAAAGSGPAIPALEQLNLTAEELQRLPLDARIIEIQDALTRFVPEAQRAAVASALFGDRAGLVFSRIDPSALRTAREELRAFGVVVSDTDAAQIERTNDALSRLGLIGRGVANQLAIALAPTLEALANAMGRLFARTGPVGQAIEVLFENIGRIASTVAAFAGIVTGRWIVAFVGARAATLRLSAALTVLRGALIRTGFFAIVVAAGELIFQFQRLVRAAGGFGEALNLLVEVGREVFDRLTVFYKAFSAEGAARAQELKASILLALDGAVAGAVAFADRSVAVMRGAFDAVRAIWGNLPTAIGDFAFRAANSLVDGVEGMLNAVVRRMNNFINAINDALSLLPEWATGEGGVRLQPIANVDLAGINNPFAGASANAGREAAEAFRNALAQVYLNAPDTGLTSAAIQANEVAAQIRAAADTFEELAGRPLQSVQRIRDLLAQVEEEGEDTTTAVTNLIQELEKVSTASPRIGAAVATSVDEGTTAINKMGEAARTVASGLVNLFDRLFTGGRVGFSDLIALAGDVANQLFRTPFINSATNGLTDFFAGFFQDGGFIPSGQFGVVGEAGPELISGGRSGVTVTPMSGTAPQASITQNFNVTADNPTSFQRSQRQTMRQARVGLGIA